MKLREKAYVDSLLLEWRYQVEKFNIRGRVVPSVFFGGGTPSLLSGEAVHSIIEGIRSEVLFAPDIEITLEANPRSIQEDISGEKLKSFFDAGVNRLSFGAQSFRKEKLDFLGRWHSPEDTERSVEEARIIGFKNINIDLMFGVKDENLADWKYELNKAISISPNHISTYMLTMEPGTAFGKRSKKGEVFITDDDSFVSLYEASQGILSEAGFHQYEVSNFSELGKECRHNLWYWSHGEYIGLGAGAHSYMRSSDQRYGLRWSNIPSPSHYVSRIKEHGQAAQRFDPLDEEKALLEYVSLGLRLKRGILLKPDSALFDIGYDRLESILRLPAFKSLVSNGFLYYSEGVLQIPPPKFYLADSIISEFCDLL